MGQTADTVAHEFDISRERQDTFGARSQQRACKATDAGRFGDEIVPIRTDDGTVTEDEGLRSGTKKIAGLSPAFREDGTVTAANAPQLSDGAAAIMLTSRGFAEDCGLDVLASVESHAVAGVDPQIMGIGPVPAVEQL